MSHFSITSPQDILRSPLNISPSKYHYSFSKQNRFRYDSPNLSCQSAFYDLPTTKMQRSSGFGFGSRSDFTKSTVISPSPTNYDINIKSPFTRKNSTQKGKSFGLAREKMKEYGHVLTGVQQNPGPGNYEAQSQLSKLQYSLRPKTNYLYNPHFLDGKTTQLQNPPPGNYEIIKAITNQGKYTWSKYKNSGATLFNPKCSKRFKKNSPYTPGPGHYKPNNDLNNSGVYVLSKNRGNGTRAFSHQYRKPFVDEIASISFTPGPGTYRTPSDFGHYDHISMYNQPMIKRKRNFSVVNKDKFNMSIG